MPIWFLAVAVVTAFFAGATASIVGFGIGSILTPVLALELGVETAVAAVALPHFAGSLLRAWRFRSSINWEVVLRFGVLSFACGALGAFAFSRMAPQAVARALGALLLLTALAGTTKWNERLRPRGPFIWISGALSGFFGGVVGNQGGLRAAALSTFGLEAVPFVATSTFIGVVVDLARTPFYLYHAGRFLLELWYAVFLLVAGVLAGTFWGERLLFKLSPRTFRIAVSLAVGLLGLWFLLHTSR